MSYNIDSINYVSGTGPLAIHNTVLREYQTHGDVPEGNFLQYPECIGEEHSSGMVAIQKPWWYGEGSGRAEPLFREILSKTMGHADLILCWAGGDAYTGLRVRNGLVTEHEVAMTLGEPG